MIIEERRDRHEGYTEVIVGGMFSGKTGAMLNKLERFLRGFRAKNRKNGQNGKDVRGVVVVFRPDVDNREPQTHCGRYQYHPISVDPHKPSEILQYIDVTICQAIGIDEAHFFSDAEGLVDLCYFLNGIGICVIVTGLDLTFDLQPFGAMPVIMSHFHVEQLYSVCWRCGSRFARLSERLVDNQGVVLVSEAFDDDSYKPCCQACHPHAIMRIGRFRTILERSETILGKRPRC